MCAGLGCVHVATGTIIQRHKLAQAAIGLQMHAILIYVLGRQMFSLMVALICDLPQINFGVVKNTAYSRGVQIEIYRPPNLEYLFFLSESLVHFNQNYDLVSYRFYCHNFKAQFVTVLYK